MGKLNLVGNGGLRLPPGFRFQPTDDEIVSHYLKRKMLSLPLPTFVIPEANVCRLDPWVLPGDPEEERYFFATMEIKYPNGKRTNRATTSGYWKATGLDKQITDSNKKVVGTKKTLVFYRGKPPTGEKSNWVMHEFKLSHPTAEMENWVVCRVCLRRRGKKEDEEEEEEEKETVENPTPVLYNFIPKLPKHNFDLNLDVVDDGENEGEGSCSSGSSGVTNVDGEANSK